jgi:hypothetical protein
MKRKTTGNENSAAAKNCVRRGAGKRLLSYEDIEVSIYLSSGVKTQDSNRE